MNFINPIEILELQNAGVNSADAILIKKAKRKLFAEIDLSEKGYIDYKGNNLTKSDCEKAIDELEDSDKTEFYSYLITNRGFNDFLVNGHEKIFSEIKQEDIYKLGEFVDFVSPYFAPKFDRSIVKAFKNNDLRLLHSILETHQLINTTNINTAFKGLSNEIHNRISEVDKITHKIKNKEASYSNHDIEELITIIEDYFPTETLNLLPPYFQSLTNKIASSVNYLAVALWHDFNSAFVPMKLLEIVFRLKIESATIPTYTKNLEIFTDKYKVQREQEINAPVLKKWANILLRIRKDIELTENKILIASNVATKTKYLFDFSELNHLPSFGDEIRTQIGYSIRALAISCWNKQMDIKSALTLIDFALQVNVPGDAKKLFEQDRLALENFEKKYKGICTCYFCDKNSPDESSRLSRTIYKETYRSHFPRRVQFTYLDVSIPRCKSCSEVHFKRSNRFAWIVLSGVFLGVFIAVLSGYHFIFGGVLGLVAGVIANKVVQRDEIKKVGIKDDCDSTLRNHPLLVDRIRQGWTFYKPTA